MKEIVFLENFGTLFDTRTIFEDKFEGRCQTSLDKMNIYIYATILSVRGDNGRAYILFK
jgi:hypothetical protein